MLYIMGQLGNTNVKRNSKEKKVTYVVENSSWDASVCQVEQYLKKNLKDPKSYDSIEWSRVTKENDNFRVRYKYRAKNSLGGYVLENQIFTLNSNGEVINVDDYLF